MPKSMQNNVNLKDNIICCICTSRDQPKYSKITENFVKVQSKFVPIREIIKQLNLINYRYDRADEVNMSSCEACQSLMVQFYLFSLRTEKLQRNFDLTELVKCQPADDVDDTGGELVMHTLDIVEKFIENLSVEIFIEDESETRLIIQKVDGIERIQSSAAMKHEINTSTDGFTDSLDLKEDSLDDQLDDEPTEVDENFDLDVEMVEEDAQEDSAQCDSFMLNDVEFVERTPEYLINAYKPSRRSKNPDNWIRNRQKSARAKGEEYVTSNGKTVPAKRMRSPCKENCRLKCYTKISESDRRLNFDNYWGLASFILQRKFIYEHHRTVPVQRRRFRSAEGGKGREYSSQFFLDKPSSDGNHEQVQVCEKMFLKTFDICRNIVSYLHKKVQSGKVQDLRGINKRKLSAGHEAAIAHIKANPLYRSDTTMSISKMYSLYQQECLDKEVEAVRNHTYRKLLAEHGEGDFLKRDKQFCSVCDEYCQTSGEERKVSEEIYQKHLQENELCLQRAKGRTRAALNTEKKRSTKQEDEQLEDSFIEDLIVEEHLSYETDEIE